MQPYEHKALYQAPETLAFSDQAEVFHISSHGSWQSKPFTHWPQCRGFYLTHSGSTGEIRWLSRVFLLFPADAHDSSYTIEVHQQDIPDSRAARGRVNIKGTHPEYRWEGFWQLLIAAVMKFTGLAIFLHERTAFPQYPRILSFWQYFCALTDDTRGKNPKENITVAGIADDHNNSGSVLWSKIIRIAAVD